MLGCFAALAFVWRRSPSNLHGRGKPGPYFAALTVGTANGPIYQRQTASCLAILLCATQATKYVRIGRLQTTPKKILRKFWLVTWFCAKESTLPTLQTSNFEMLSYIMTSGNIKTR